MINFKKIFIFVSCLPLLISCGDSKSSGGSTGGSSGNDSNFSDLADKEMQKKIKKSDSSNEFLIEKEQEILKKLKKVIVNEKLYKIILKIMNIKKNDILFRLGFDEYLQYFKKFEKNIEEKINEKDFSLYLFYSLLLDNFELIDNSELFNEINKEVFPFIKNYFYYGFLLQKKEITENIKKGICGEKQEVFICNDDISKQPTNNIKELCHCIYDSKYNNKDKNLSEFCSNVNEFCDL